MKYFLTVLSTLLLLGCQADPDAKLVPKDDKKIVNKGLNNISFNPAVDILFVVDDSYSMYDYQVNIATNADLFVDEIFKSKFIDYHIGVTTSTRFSFSSSNGGGKLVSKKGVKFVDRNTPEGKTILADMIVVGTSGSASEEFFSIVNLAFSPELTTGHNKGFYRKDAFLAIFYVTDTDDQSDFSVADHIDDLMILKNNNKKKIHYTAALIDQKITNDCNRSGELFPRKIKDAVDTFNGSIFELCDADYGKSMAKVAQRIVNDVSTIYLDELPDVTTLEVSYGGIVLPQGINGWSYDPDLNAIRISPNTKISQDKAAKLNIKFEAIY